MIEELSAEQQAITKDIVRGLTSEEGFELFMKQMDDDWGGLSQYSMAIFGNPHKDRFEFALTGRHLTLRADGNTDNGGSKDGNSGHGVAFGGPIIYGHAEESPKENLFYYQTKQAHEVFKMLDGSQRAKALLAKAPRENAVQIRKPSQALPGISGSELSSDQKDRLEQTLQAVLSPYRKEDVDEVVQLMKASGGLDKVHMAFYRTGAGGETGDVLAHLATGKPVTSLPLPRRAARPCLHQRCTQGLMRCAHRTNVSVTGNAMHIDGTKPVP